MAAGYSSGTLLKKNSKYEDMTLLNLFDNYIPFVLTTHSATFKLNNFWNMHCNDTNMGQVFVSWATSL